MDEKTRPNEIYITITIHISNEENDSFDATFMTLTNGVKMGLTHNC